MAITKLKALGVTDGTLTNTQINASAAIAKTKLAALDIVNADVNASAAIAATKVASDFALIHTIDASNQAAVTFTSSHITDDYMDYKIMIRYMAPSTNGQALYIWPSIDNGANYNVLIEQIKLYRDLKASNATGTASSAGNSAAKIDLNAGIENTANKGNSVEINLIGLRQTTGWKGMYYNSIGAHNNDGGHNTGNDYWWNGAAKIIGTSNTDRTKINNIRITAASGNVNQGKFSLYGIKA